jgi:rhodanese-related sulfurtransferase
MAYSGRNDEGVLSNEIAVAATMRAHRGAFLPTVSVAEAARLLNDHAAFIDARAAEDFEAGHVPGAISLSVKASPTKVDQTMSSIPKEARIVVYCQSRGCTFAEQMAILLLDRGYQDVSIYKGGWVEWNEKMAQVRSGR